MSTQDEEKIASLSQQLHAAQVRIGKIESSNTADCEAWREWARWLTGFAEGSTDGGMRSGVDSRIAELEAQLAAAESARDHAISFQAANVARCERLEDALEKADRALDAKPVLTAAERRVVEAWRHNDSLGRALVAIIDRLCPPPKAPPTDAELAQKVMLVAGAMHGTAQAKALEEVHDALRARGAK